MTSGEALAKLQPQADAVRAMGATTLYLYGSTVANAAMPSSDLDLFIDHDPSSRFNAFALVGIELLLEDRLGIPVDLANTRRPPSRLRDSIEAAAIRVV